MRKAARTREEAEDEDDRMKELEEAALRTHNGNAGSVEASNGRTETAAAQTTYPAPPSVKKEVALDPNDGIMKVRFPMTVSLTWPRCRCSASSLLAAHVHARDCEPPHR